ncbi:MAG: A/G-specific adenine glycosylase [Chitinophagales bacterium]
MKHPFTEYLLQWAKENPRNLPWKDTKDPYKIWLSEIILQQTRVAQGKPYYEKFAATYPKVEDLANAPEDEVMRMWEGLGYYSRARNMHAAAKYIAYELKGKFPDSHKEILQLKGVGAYTAAAIASFAFDLPHPVVDGNVYRVLSRRFGIETPIDSTEGKKEFALLAEELLDKENPSVYNQAIMDFGSLQCTPNNPNCGNCPLQENCVAFHKGLISKLPIKGNKLKKTTRYFHYLMLQLPNEKFLLQKRVGKGIWRNLYQFPLIEGNQLLDLEELRQTEEWNQLFINQKTTVKKASKTYKHLLTHQTIFLQFFELQLKESPPTLSDCIEVDAADFDNYAFPRVMNRFLEDRENRELGQLDMFS